MKNDGGPAFPVPDLAWVNGKGMSLRDWFAGQALSATIQRGYYTESRDIAVRVYQIADAMLKARENS